MSADQSPLSMSLPPPTARVCNECPWRRESAPGWLGPFGPDKWVALAHSEQPIACHKTICDDGAGWDEPGLRQCAGAAQYRRNVAKRPINPEVAVAADTNIEQVFATPMEFKEHHT